MNRFFLTLSTVWFAFSLSFSQNTADSLRREGDLPVAIEAYKALLEFSPGNPVYAYNLARTYALNWGRDSAFHYLSLALRQDSTVRALTEPDFFNLTEDPRWPAMEEMQIYRYENRYGKLGDQDLARRLWRMKMKDQAYYYHLDLVREQMGDRSPVVRALWDLKKKLNRENLDTLQAILLRDGWPRQSAVGTDAAGTAFLIIQNAGLEIQKKYIEFLREACEADEARWSDFALLYDRIQLGEGQPQLYGSQVVRHPQTGRLEPYPILEPATVNERRAAMGLGPIEDYLARWGIPWPPQE